MLGILENLPYFQSFWEDLSRFSDSIDHLVEEYRGRQILRETAQNYRVVGNRDVSLRKLAIEAVNNNYLKLKLNHFYDVTHPDDTHDNLGPPGRGQRIFYRSDHYNFAKVGVPIAFFTTGLHVDYHRPTDTPEKIDYKEMQTISKTMAAVAWELATQPGRPKINATLPDDLKKDMETVQKQGWGKQTPVLAPLPGMPY